MRLLNEEIAAGVIFRRDLLWERGEG